MFNEWIFPDRWQVMVATLCSVLHQRSAWRLDIITAGIVFAKGRRTVTNWFRWAGISRRYKAFYYFIGSIGRKTEVIATVLFEFMINLIYRKNNRILMGIDDTPTRRYGPKVQGAGIHRNPAVGPDGAKFVYGHIWVTLSALVRHKRWGTIGLPVLAKMYIRAKNIVDVPAHYKLGFKNKLQQAAELVNWAQDSQVTQNSVVRIQNTEGGFKTLLLQSFCVLAPVFFFLAVFQIFIFFTFHCYSAKHENSPYSKFSLPNSFLRRAFMCTNLSATAKEILEAVSDRSAIEQNFHDLKEIEGVGQQQVRNFWANVGVFHLNMWVHTMVELWAWNKPAAIISDRRNSPWDGGERRPSHADRCAGLRRQVVAKTFFETSGHSRKTRKIIRQFYKLMKLAA